MPRTRLESSGSIKMSLTKHLSISILLTSLIFSSLAFLPTPSLSLPLDTSTCVTQDKPNPIAAQYLAQYPNDTTGTINGTFSILPVDYTTARAIVPPQYEILRKPWAALFPEWEKKNIYPMLLETLHDHDIVNPNSTTPEFSRASLTLPFIDLLHDNYSSFRYTYGALLSFANPIAIVGIFGQPYPIKGYFDPPCDAYRFATAADYSSPHEQQAKKAESGIKDVAERPIVFDGYVSATKKRVVKTLFFPLQGKFDSVSSIPLFAYKNLTNQPLFQNGTYCDNFITLYNTSVTTDAPPQAVVGFVTLKPPYFPKERTWWAVSGFKADLAFITTIQGCKSLDG